MTGHKAQIYISRSILLTMKYWLSASCLGMALLLILPFNASADGYSDLNIGWVNDDVYMDNDFTMDIQIGGESISSGYVTSVSSNYSFCYYYWESDSFGFTDSSDIGDYELSETWDDGAKINEYGISEDFYTFAIARNYTYDTYHFSANDTPNSGSRITRVAVVAKFYIGSDNVPEGWLSVQYSEGAVIPDLIPWGMNVREYDAKYHTLDSYGWYNSSLIPNIESVAFFRYEDIVYLWEVTDFYDWTYDMLISDDVFVMWTGKQNCSDVTKLSFLGLYWEYNMTYEPIGNDEVNPFVVEPEEMPEIDFETNMMGMIWLIVLFIPPIAMGVFVPKLGYIAGMSLMLVILSITQDGFFVVTALGTASLGALVYRG
jgi:hypothetical protein